MELRACNHAIVAGLFASLAFAAALAVAPDIALAEESQSALPRTASEPFMEEDEVLGDIGSVPGSLDSVENGLAGGSVDVDGKPSEMSQEPEAGNADGAKPDTDDADGTDEADGTDDTENPDDTESGGPSPVPGGVLAPELGPSDVLGAGEEEGKLSGADNLETANGISNAPVLGWGTNAAGEIVYVDSVREDGSAVYRTGWLVDSGRGQGLQRYWFSSTGALVVGRLIDAGGGWWAYARPDGYVVRGRWTDPATCYVYLADNDGRLERVGWIVSDAYGQGLQRYWIDPDAHAAVPGRSEDGYAHYTTPEGYVARGAVDAGDGEARFADNDGRLAVSGWVATDAFGQGFQRYWFDADGAMAKGRLVDPSEGAGYWAYARPEGLVVRGKYDDGAGRVYLAGNDGRLAEGSGWIVTGAYDGGVLQRYFLDGAAHAARSGYFSDGGGNYFGVGGQGYVLRGVGRGVRDDWLVADNDGRLASSRWVVTDAFGHGLQRYWFGADGAMAKGRLVSIDEGAGWWAYAQANGVILRGKRVASNMVYLANNDGQFVVGSGWIVTGSYDGGVLQRYWIEQSTIGFSFAKVGFFQALSQSGKVCWFYGDASQGYVLRGKKTTNYGVLPATNEGS